MTVIRLTGKDLMIEDWVQVPSLIDNTEGDKGFRQVRQLRDDDLDVIGFKEIFYHELRPIPLTHKILKKNGFKATYNICGNKNIWSLRTSENKSCYIYEHHNKHQFPYFWIDTGSNPDIKYVHQLQHCLRLCEIEKDIIL